MKRFQNSSLALGVGVFVDVTLARIFDGVPRTAAAGGGQGGGVDKCAAKNGDVNAGGKINLSDAVTILGNLFLGNPTKLVPLSAPPAAPSGLPATGQTKCYGQNGTEISCDGATCPGQDASYAAGCPSEGRFDDNGDGTVTGHCTGLIWQKDTADANSDGQSTELDYLPWCDALAYCEKLSFAGHDDWRLPNVRELHSIVDYGGFHRSSIDPVFGALSSVYWSSTSRAGAPGFAWGVFFVDGIVGSVSKDSIIYVRAMHSGP